MLLLAMTTALAFECGTLDHLDAIREAPRPPVMLAPPSGDRDLRDPFEAGPYVETTEHFAIRWGPDIAYPASTIEQVSVALEEIWVAQIDEMGWPQPRGTDRYLLNVYFGSTGGNTPEITFAGAYVTVDEEGYPFIVVSPLLLAAYDYGDVTSVPGVLAHEFMHTIQTSVDSFVYLDRGGWIWEASAEWAVPRTYPDSPSIGNVVGAYLMLPHVSVDHFDYPDSGALIESHHYGAEIFLEYLTTVAADDSLMQDVWLGSSIEDIPLDVIGAELEARGVSPQDAFLDFAVRNVTLDDYRYGGAYAGGLELFSRYYPDDDARYAATISRDGTDGWDRVVARRPWGWGYNHILMNNPPGGTLAVGVQPKPRGTLESPAELSAALVAVTDDGYTVHPVLDAQTGGEITYASPGDELYLVLVVAATPATYLPEEAFKYDFRMEWTERAYAEGSDGEGPTTVHTACACGTGGAGGWLALGLVPLLVRRRR